MSESTHHDKDTHAFFKEVEKESNKEYETCSVIDLFDEVFNCYSLISQARNYYRYGEKRDCQSKWDDMTLCIKTKTKSAEATDKLLKERKAAKEAIRLQGRHSEEVWEAKQ